MNAPRQQAWRALALRHLEMAELLTPRFPDGGFFHVYHAFECLACSRILAITPDKSIPVGHGDKIDLLMDLLGEAPLADRIAALWTDLDRRNEALYVGWKGRSIRTPDQLFRGEEVGLILKRVRDLAHDMECSRQ